MDSRDSTTVRFQKKLSFQTHFWSELELFVQILDMLVKCLKSGRLCLYFRHLTCHKIKWNTQKFGIQIFTVQLMFEIQQMEMVWY